MAAVRLIEGLFEVPQPEVAAEEHHNREGVHTCVEDRSVRPRTKEKGDINH